MLLPTPRRDASTHGQPVLLEGGAAPHRRRILVVDDIDANRLMLQMFLEQHGIIVDHASGGEEAVRLAGAGRYDAILMDLHMPVVDGYTAARRIRAAEPAGQRTLIIAVTACAGHGTRELCVAAGMDAYFTKPLELRKFCRTLFDLLAAATPSA